MKIELLSIAALLICMNCIAINTHKINKRTCLPLITNAVCIICIRSYAAILYIHTHHPPPRGMDSFGNNAKHISYYCINFVHHAISKGIVYPFAVKRCKILPSPLRYRTLCLLSKNCFISSSSPNKSYIRILTIQFLKSIRFAFYALRTRSRTIRICEP